MTEAEWQASDHRQLVPLLNTLVGPGFWQVPTTYQRLTARKFRLMACAALHRLPAKLLSAVPQLALDLANQLAEGECSESAFRSVAPDIRAVPITNKHSCLTTSSRAERSRQEARYLIVQAISGLCWPPSSAAVLVISNSALAMKYWAKAHNWAARPTANKERKAQLALLRCIFGNPFRPVAFAPNWRSEIAVALAAGIYEERAFDRLPVLADALEEAGCDHPDVLSHCRDPGPHARGCWVVDGVLDKQ